MKATILLSSLLLLLLTGCLEKDEETSSSSSTTIDSLTITGATSTSFALYDKLGIDHTSKDTASGSPTQFNIKFYRVWVSENTDCSSPHLVADNGTSSYKDMMLNPTLISGTPPAGSYHCVIVELNNTLTFKADSTAVNDHTACADTTTTYNFSICHNEDWSDYTGTSTTTCTSTGDDSAANKVTIFITTNTGDLPGSVNSHQQMALANPLVVDGATSAAFVMNPTNKVYDNSGTCEVDQPAASFVTQ